MTVTGTHHQQVGEVPYEVHSRDEMRHSVTCVNEIMWQVRRTATDAALVTARFNFVARAKFEVAQPICCRLRAFLLPIRYVTL